MKNKLFYYQLLHEREEQLMNKAGAETFHISIGLLFLAYFIAVLAPSLFNPSMLLAITTLLMLQNYQFNIEIYQHNPLHIKYIYAWVFTYIFYLPWIFIGNLGLKSYGEWAQKKYEKDMDELESME